MARRRYISSGGAITEGRDFYLEVARDKVDGTSYIQKFGRNTSIGTASAEDIWDGGGNYTFLTTARIHDIASTDSNDTSVGTGARTIIIIGLDANYDEISETVTMNGTSNVPTVNRYLRVYQMYVVTVGSTGSAQGNITAIAQTDSIITAQITGDINQTLMAIYTVPVNKSAYLLEYHGNISKKNVATGVIQLRIAPENQAFQTKHVMGLHSQGSSYFSHQFRIPLVVDEKSDIRVRAKTDANNTEFLAGFDMILVNKTY